MMPVGFILSLALALGPGGAVPGHFLILSLPAPSTLTLFIARTGLSSVHNPRFASSHLLCRTHPYAPFCRMRRRHLSAFALPFAGSC